MQVVQSVLPYRLVGVGVAHQVKANQRMAESSCSRIFSVPGFHVLSFSTPKFFFLVFSPGFGLCATLIFDGCDTLR